MWLTNSSVGRKFVMAITGMCLVLFVTFHCLMNSVALIWPTAYNQVCEFLGANWYALIATIGLAALFILHIIYALWLTLQNRAARGADRYAVNGSVPQVQWSSKNMLVLGIVVLAFLVVHLIQFWAKMQWQELRHAELAVLPQLDGVPVNPAHGTLFLEMAFKEVWTPIVYIIGFIALWFHMNHGFWSMFHTVGWDNNKWLPRLKKTALVWTSVVVALFIAQAIVFTVQAHKGYYTKSPELQEQYAETWNKAAETVVNNFQTDIKADFRAEAGDLADKDPNTMTLEDRNKYVDARNKAEQKFLDTKAQAYVDKMTIIEDAFKKQCPDVKPSAEFQEMLRLKMQLSQVLEMIKNNPNQNN